MKKKSPPTFWIAHPMNPERQGPVAFPTKKAAMHWIEHSVEGFFHPENDPHGFRLFKTTEVAEYRVAGSR